jgi:hypothetical protein
MRHGAVTLVIAVPMAIMATGGATMLLRAEVTALDAADCPDTPPPPPFTDGYRPGPGWMHRDAHVVTATRPSPVSHWHALTNAGVSPTLERWIPLP